MNQPVKPERQDGGQGETLEAELVRRAGTAHLTLATAESLTAGLIAATIANVPGSSAVLTGGVISYASTVKAALLGVPQDLLDRVGSVDAAVARSMADGARSACAANIGVSATGVAGPEPHDGKPVGTVFIGIATPKKTTAQEFNFSGDRHQIREQSVQVALELVVDFLKDQLSADQKAGTNPGDR